jgi:penicillin amidase
MQLDVVSERGGELVEAALAVEGGESGDGNEAVAILRDWDHQTAPDSAGAAVYHLFLDRLLRELFAERLGEEVLERYLGLGRVSPTALVERVVAGGDAPAPWSDRQRVAAAVTRSLRDVGYRLPVELGANRKKWVWGRLHGLRFAPLWRRGGGDPLGPYPLGGDEGSLLAAEYRPLHSFAPQIVPSYRLLVDTAALDEALTSLAPGQSEHPGHPHRDDGVPRWLAGRPALLATSRLAVEDGAVATLRLEPAP